MPSYSDYDGRRPYADVIGAFRGGAGRAYQSQGRYDDAIRIDPDNADAYMSLRNAEEARRREEESRNANRATAEALRQGDYDGAERAAAGQGDVGTVTAVQRMRRENDRTRRVEAWRELRRYRSEVNGLADLQGDEQQARYADILNRARAESADSPEMLQFLSTLPAQFNPRVGGMLDARLRDWMEMLLDPEELAEMEREEARAERGQRRTLTPEEVRAAGLRPGTVAQTDGSGQIYVIQQPHAPSGGAGAGSGAGGLTDSVAFARANTLRDEYNQQTQSYRIIADIARRSEEYAARVARDQRAASGQGDVGLVYALAKIYDPTSVVRESEFATMARQGGYGEQMRSWVNQALGRGFSPQIRAQILTEIRNGLRAQQAQRNQARARYEALARRSGIDPALVIDDYDAAPAVSGGGLAASAAATQGAGASGAGRPGYNPDDPNTWTSEERRRWLAEHPE